MTLSAGVRRPVRGIRRSRRLFRFKTPNTDLPGIEDSSGEIVHSAEYRNNDRFCGTKVLIVGLAESGADIVREIGDVAESCALSIRSCTWLLPRVFDGDKSTDHGTVRAHHQDNSTSAQFDTIVLCTASFARTGPR
ncbi:hypothetical protein [Gordonia bronchialis]|uniref:hypothetical protein n=1 Tax=Gordonia bronchialis TaxID=2054 RepID=UPI003119341A